ncbi:MAG: hypothetical protein HYT61_00105 [Candidatus Yanofskybacteria bacterium]|nr:hypothetical protein [Candidatus Yanofskybacteria bacterium]
MEYNSLKLSPYSVDGMQTPGFNYGLFQDKLDNLPTNLVDFLLDSSVPDFIMNLTQKHVQLSIRGPDIARLIRDIVIGDVFVGDMPQELSRRLGTDLATSREIANQIASQLFTPILEDIKKVQMVKFPGKLPAKPVSQPAPQVKPTETHYQGEELPESGGNIIDLRSKS